MGKCTFKGGVHPFDGKELSKDKPIKELFPEGDMVYPLSQHIGAPAVPVVAKGDYVKVGQRIGQIKIGLTIPIEFVIVDELDETERNSGSYGSTGV